MEPLMAMPKVLWVVMVVQVVEVVGAQVAALKQPVDEEVQQVQARAVVEQVITVQMQAQVMELIVEVLFVLAEIMLAVPEQAQDQGAQVVHSGVPAAQVDQVLQVEIPEMANQVREHGLPVLVLLQHMAVAQMRQT
jgi:4-amino-4-deoxy-L-arabinose transferase-like glycosyltransferase